MRTTITEAAVKRVSRPGFLRDDKLIGFALRTTPRGAKSFVVEARVAGRPKRFTIGPVQRFTVAEAREKARALLHGMANGQDPQIERRAARERSGTLRELLDEYIGVRSRRQDEPLRASTAKKYRDVVRRCLADWLDRPLSEITGSMVAARYEDLLTRSTADANNAMRVLRAVSRRAIRVLPLKADGTRIIAEPATAALSGQWATIKRRTSVLEPSDLGPWLTAVKRLRSSQSSRALQTLLLTGLRVSEALQLEWDNIDTDGRRLYVRQSKTTGFIKPIGQDLARMLHDWRPPGRAHGPVFGIKDLRAALISVAAMGGKLITPHDLRRTFLSFGERCKLPTKTLKLLVNHATGDDVTAGYVQVAEEDLLRAAESIEAAILRAAEGAQVVPLRRSA
jgi:integrase